MLSVSDTGLGIPEAELPRLFERFHRVEGAQGRSFEGSGIGLALVQELVRLHGGTVGVESRPGEGSTFTVSLPSAPPTCGRPPARRTDRPLDRHALAGLRRGGDALARRGGTRSRPGTRPRPVRPQGSGASRRRQRRHARLRPAPAGRCRPRRRGGGRRPRGAVGRPTPRARRRRLRRDDAGPRRVRAPRRAAGRSGPPGHPGDPALGPGGRGGADRGPGRGRRRLPRQAVLGPRAAGADREQPAPRPRPAREAPTPCGGSTRPWRPRSPSAPASATGCGACRRT